MAYYSHFVPCDTYHADRWYTCFSAFSGSCNYPFDPFDRTRETPDIPLISCQYNIQRPGARLD